MYSMPASARWSSVSKVCVRPGPNQPRGRLPGELLDHAHGPGDDGALVVELVHGDLLVGVRVELPAAVHAGPDHLRVGLADLGIDGHRRLGADALVHLAHAPEGDAHAVLVPAPVGQIGQLRRPLRRRDHHARHRPRQVPVLQAQHRPHHQADAVGKLQRRALLDRAKRRGVRGDAWQSPSATVSYRGLSPVSSHPRTPERAARWIAGTSPAMTPTQTSAP